MPDDVESVDSAVVHDGDLMVVAGRSKGQKWFLRALNSQGAFLWESRGEGRIYDLAVSYDGKELYAVGCSVSSPLFIVAQSASGAIQFHAYADGFRDDKDSIYKQLVVTGDENVVIASHTKDQGRLRYIKWQKYADAVTGDALWRSISDFCEGCERYGVDSVALKNDSKHQLFFAVVSDNTGLHVSLRDARTGWDLVSKTLPASGAWEQTVFVDGVALNQVTPTEKQLALMSDDCRLNIKGKKSMMIELCPNKSGGQRKLLQMTTDDLPNRSMEIPDNIDYGAGIIQAIETLSAIVGIVSFGGILTGITFWFNDRFKHWKEKVIAANNKEFQRRKDEGILLRGLEAHRPTLSALDFKTVTLTPSSVPSPQASELAEGVGTEVGITSTVSTAALAKQAAPQTPLEVLRRIMEQMEYDDLSDEWKGEWEKWIEQNRDLINMIDEDSGNNLLHYLTELNYNGLTEEEKAKLKEKASLIASALVDNGIVFNFRSKSGFTPLELAAINSQADLFKQLLYTNVYPTLDELSMLYHIAVRVKDSEIFKVMLERGYFYLKNNQVKQPFYQEVLKPTRRAWITPKTTIRPRSFQNEKGQTLLHEAAYYRNRDVVKILINLELVDIDSQDEDGNTALHLAASRSIKDECDIPDLLIKRGAEVTIPNHDGDNPLHLILNARVPDVTDTVDLMLKHHIDIDSSNRNKHTPLHFAIANRRTPEAQLLLERGANVNKANKAGMTPLHLAVVSEQPELVELLLTHNANVNLTNEDGWTPVLQAVVSDQTELVKLLLTHNANVNLAGKGGRTPLNWAVCNKQLELVELLLTHNADVNHADKDGGWTPILQAVFDKQPELVELILKYKPDVNLVDEGGRTPLYWAVLNKQPELVELLLKHNADVNKANKKGRTPLCTAAYLGEDELIKKLLAYGAERTLVTGDGETAYDLAKQEGHEEAMKLLSTSADVVLEMESTKKQEN